MLVSYIPHHALFFGKETALRFRQSLVGALSGTLLLSCASPVPPSPTAEPEATGKRQVLATVACPGGGEVTPMPSASPAPLAPVAKLPAGSGIHLDFRAQTAGAPASGKISYVDGAPFTVRFVDGARFEVIDADARDGEAVVQLPAGIYDGYMGTSGKPDGQLGIEDPIYRLSDTWFSTGGKRDWAHLGLRRMPLAASYGLGDYRLTLDPQGISQFTARWFPVDDPGAAAPVPPLPPAIAGLSGPDQVQPGAVGTISADVTDPNGDALTYTWTTTGPDGQVVSGNPVNGQWTAPLAAGTYRIGLTVTDGDFATSACEPLPIVVPNVCPAAAAAGTWPTSANAGQTLSLGATASDANGDALSWRWTASGGTLSADGASAGWTAPAAAGDYTVSALVKDANGCEVPVTGTIRVIAPSPTPTPVPSSTSFKQGTKLRVGLLATSGPDSQAIVTQEFDLAGLPKPTPGRSMRISYYKPATHNYHRYERDNSGANIGFTWNCMYFGTAPFYSYASSVASFYISSTSVKDGTLYDVGTFTSSGVLGGTAVLLDGMGVPVPADRSTISTVAVPVGALVNNLKMVKAVLKSTSLSYPQKTYMVFFSDGSVGLTDSYSGGKVTGTVIAETAPKGRTVLPVGARFRCGVLNDSLVEAYEPFHPVKPPVITRW
jgi:hypothetical protein